MIMLEIGPSTGLSLDPSVFPVSLGVCGGFYPFIKYSSSTSRVMNTAKCRESKGEGGKFSALVELV